MTTTTQMECTAGELLIAFELSQRTWKLAFGRTTASTTRLVTVPAGDRARVVAEIAKTKRRWELAASAPVWSVYEIGRDGFWIHRWLTQIGVTSLVLEASSIEVPRRLRRTKTDRLDAGRLLALLRRYRLGERGACAVVRVPSEADEDRRHVHRALEAARADRTRAINRIYGLLATQGATASVTGPFGRQIARLTRWDGQRLPPALQQRLTREWAQVVAIDEQIATLEHARAAAMAVVGERAAQQTTALRQLVGIDTSAWTFVTELFAWRDFRNGREIAAVTGLAPTLAASGATQRPGGISQAGRREVRSLAVQIAWQWLGRQPASALSRWYQARWSHAGKRGKKIGIVALARKLLIALWRFVTTGALPAGAVLKPATA